MAMPPGVTGWIFAAIAIIAIGIVWMEIPETKDLTFAQIDQRFELRVCARDFRTWQGGDEERKVLNMIR
ncbi:hypothetical protein B0T24DRAFT_602233 [Lasiosphaeria ovina]|uniref:Uncharacterized protein n=1 Tax=Lasiosphaeria ovina TaxID=92902 RepID=A0AAE0NJH4_9PEZI|nr:hypothetical protein B0T24DRAFT_602233 [Lasiosphaeria ovina]